MEQLDRFYGRFRYDSVDLLAVSALELIGSFLIAVPLTMSQLLAVGTLDLHPLSLDLVRFAMFTDMPHLCSCVRCIMVQGRNLTHHRNWNTWELFGPDGSRHPSTVLS